MVGRTDCGYPWLSSPRVDLMGEIQSLQGPIRPHSGWMRHPSLVTPWGSGGVSVGSRFSLSDNQKIGLFLATTLISGPAGIIFGGGRVAFWLWRLRLGGALLLGYSLANNSDGPVTVRSSPGGIGAPSGSSPISTASPSRERLSRPGTKSRKFKYKFPKPGSPASGSRQYEAGKRRTSWAPSRPQRTPRRCPPGYYWNHSKKRCVRYYRRKR